MINEAMTPEELFQKNVKLVGYCLKGVVRDHVVRSNEDDIWQEGAIGLWKACLKFNPNLGFQFATFAIPTIRNAINMWFRSERKWNRLPKISLDAPVDAESEKLTVGDMIEDPVKVDVSDSDFYKFLSTQRPRVQEVVALKAQGLSDKEIAFDLGITQSYTSRILSKVFREYVEWSGSE